MKKLAAFQTKSIGNTTVIKGGNRDKKYKSKSGTVTIVIYSSEAEID